MNCHPLASSASAAATAPSSSPGSVQSPVYDNNNTIPTEYSMHHQQQQADISGGGELVRSMGSNTWTGIRMRERERRGEEGHVS